MTRIVLLTPAADGPYGTVWGPYFDRLAGHLAAEGLTAAPLDWRRAGEADGDVVMPSLAWGYHLDPDAWFAALDAMADAGVRTLNDLPMLRWNTAKTYLADLMDADVPVVPTRHPGRGRQRPRAAGRRRAGGQAADIRRLA
ncbi:MAG TPA: hypothetical protein PLF78_05435 [Caulobacter sp.]|nr:hypothetical protein [Caulobacter sp.]